MWRPSCRKPRHVWVKINSGRFQFVCVKSYLESAGYLMHCGGLILWGLGSAVQ